MGKVIIRVPATSANLGSGVDSVGIAFHLYFTVIVEEQTEKWKVNHALGSDIPTDKNNLIVQTILKVNPKVMPHQLTVISDVPIAHGLGSSTTAVIAGIKIANILGEMDLSLEEQINIGSKMEGHPENIAAGLLGSMVVASFDGEKTLATKIPVSDISALMYIRPDGISEKESRKKLPKTINYAQAIYSSGRENLFVALMAQGKWQQALPLMEGDKFHEPYRSDLVPELATIRKEAHREGIFATYLSGAGPAIGTLGKKSSLIELRIKLE